MATVKCQECSQAIVGTPRTLDKKKLCRNCYQTQVNKIEAVNEEKQELISYTRQLFGLSVFPFEWEYQLESLIKEGKTCAGIQKTLYYFYEILGSDLLPSYGLNIVKPKYEEAKDYFQKTSELWEKNQTKQITDTVRIVKISPPKGKIL